MNRFGYSLGVITAAVGLGIASGPAQASLINLDINGRSGGNPSPANYSYDGPGVLQPAVTGSWNVVDYTGVNGSPSFANLAESDGTASTVSVDLTYVKNGNNVYSPNITPGVPRFGGALMRDGVFMSYTDSFLPPGQTYDVSTITLSNLDDMTGYVGGLTTFNLVLYANGVGGAAEDAQFTIDGVTKTIASDAFDQTQFVEGVDYVIFTGLTAVNGSINITWEHLGGNNGGTNATAFNGLQIEAVTVPEPGSLLLGALAALVLASPLRRSA